MTEMKKEQMTETERTESTVDAANDVVLVQQVALQNWTRSQNQLWKLEQVSGNKYRIKNAASNLYLDVKDANPNSGAELMAYMGTGGANQEFTFEECNWGLIGAHLIKTFSGKAIENAYGVYDRMLAIWDVNREMHQQWVLVNMDNGNCAIFNQRSGWVLGTV